MKVGDLKKWVREYSVMDYNRKLFRKKQESIVQVVNIGPKQIRIKFKTPTGYAFKTVKREALHDFPDPTE